MNGAENLIKTAVAAGVDTCFANPGTTEMQLVAALDAVPSMRSLLGLFEGVCTGAADGYGRMTGKPALTLLHLGPGFANGIANLHNARRAGSPIVNLVGDHATWHRDADAPLTSDIVSLATPVSRWVGTVGSAADMSRDTARAIAEACGPPTGIATLIVPQDCAWDPAPAELSAAPQRSHQRVSEQALGRSVEALRSGKPALLLLGDRALTEEGLLAAERVRGASGCDVMVQGFPARVEMGAGLPHFGRVPYFPEQAVEALAKYERIILAGAIPPVAFFGYPGQPSQLLPEAAQVYELARREHDIAGALESVAEELGAAQPKLQAVAAPESASGKLDTMSIGQSLAAALPEHAIVVDEAATSGLGLYVHNAGSPRHTVLNLTGGAIGQGLPCAVGAAVACPQRPVIAFQADGSAMYTLQALWTMARENLDVTVVLCSNRSYRILKYELGRAGVSEPGPAARALTDLDRPPLDWVALAKGHGVPATSCTRAEDLADEVRRAVAEPGPSLIEARIG